MTHGSLFSGIGGFDLAAQRCGIENRWQVEIDGYARMVLRKNFPEVRRYGDIRNIDPGRLERVDIITGGFPCQPYSFAGKRRGSMDDRALWPQMLRIIEGIRPRWVIGENVVGFANMGLSSSVSELESVGYTVTVFEIPACAVGAIHRRSRLWIIANRAVVIGEGPRTSVGFAPVDAEPVDTVKDVANSYGNPSRGEFNVTDRSGLTNCRNAENGTQWEFEPAVGRVANGVSYRVDRIKGLGNAIVPQVAEILFRSIQAVEER